MTYYGPWVQPDDIYVTASKTTTRRGWERGLEWRGPSQAGSFSVFSDAYTFLQGLTAVVYPDTVGWLPEYSGGADGISLLNYSYHRGQWAIPHAYYTYEAGLTEVLTWWNLACTIPAGNPANPTPSEIPDGATVEWETPTGAYTGEIRYGITAFAADDYGTVGERTGRVLIKPETGPGIEWPGVDAMKGTGWTVSDPISSQQTLQFLLASTEACITAMPSEMYDGVPLPDTADTLRHGIMRAGVTEAAPSVTPSFATHARYVPPRYRFASETPLILPGGQWLARQYRNPGGNAGGWPARQYPRGGATGSWAQRHTQDAR